MFTVKWRKYDKTELNLETIPFEKKIVIEVSLLHNKTIMK